MTYPQEGGARCLWDVVEFLSCMSAIWEQHICLFCEKRDLLTPYNRLEAFLTFQCIELEE